MSLDPRAAAEAIISEADAQCRNDVPTLRAFRRRVSAEWRPRTAGFVLHAARELVRRDRYRWIAYELVRRHGAAFRSLNDQLLRELGGGLGSWGSVDAFGRTLAGPAWAQALASDTLIDGWSCADDRWLRRLALVCTVALNTPSDGGGADPERTLRLCERLREDRDDMVEKALSWALRALAKRDPAAVWRFLAEHDAELGARVRREVLNKLCTGLKNPRRHA